MIKIETRRVWDNALQGILPDKPVEPFSLDELQDIIQYQPLIPTTEVGEDGLQELPNGSTIPKIYLRLEDYLFYREQPLENIYSYIPGLEPLLKHYDLDNRDAAFFFATRRWLPDHENLSTQLDRWEQYGQLESIFQDLMDLLYDLIGTTDQKQLQYAVLPINKYVNSLTKKKSPRHNEIKLVSYTEEDFERTIIAFNNSPEIENEVDSLAQYYNITIPVGYDTDIYFYDALKDLITQYKNSL